MNKTRVFFACFLLLFLSCSVDAGEKKETKRIDKPEITKPIDQVEKVKKELLDDASKESGDAYSIIGLKAEALKWKKDFYAQKSVAMQLKAMVELWNKPEFQDNQRLGRETDKELKRLLILN